MRKQPYCCPRCGFETLRKDDMRRHLSRKHSCPACKQQIDITEDIKQCVLDNRVYIKPEAPKAPSITQIINNYNTINNVVAKMDPLEKLMNVLQYKNIEAIDFKSSVEQALQPKLIELEAHSDTTLDQKDIMSIIDTLTSFTNVECMNMVYDDVPDKLKIFHSGEWKPYIMDIGVEMIISTLKTIYLDRYELYLIQKYHKSRDIFEKQCIKERVQDYYKFIACFDLSPTVNGRPDGRILQTSQRSHDLEEYFYPIYKRIQDDLKHYFATSLKKNVVQLVKKNNKAGILELNKEIMDLIQMDEVFKNDILHKMSISFASS